MEDYLVSLIFLELCKKGCFRFSQKYKNQILNDAMLFFRKHQIDIVQDIDGPVYLQFENIITDRLVADMYCNIIKKYISNYTPERGLI